MNIVRWVDKLLYNLLLSLYAPKDDKVTACDAIITHSAGTNKNGSFSDSTIKSFERATKIARDFPEATLYIAAPGFYKKEWEAECEAKSNMARINKVAKVETVPDGARNTVEEVRFAIRVLPKDLKNLVVVCDKPQMRSAGIIWQHYLPQTRVYVMGVKAEWPGNHRSWSLSSNLGALLTNMVRHAMLKILGVEKTGAFINPQY